MLLAAELIKILLKSSCTRGLRKKWKYLGCCPLCVN